MMYTQIQKNTRKSKHFAKRNPSPVVKHFAHVNFYSTQYPHNTLLAILYLLLLQFYSNIPFFVQLFLFSSHNGHFSAYMPSHTDLPFPLAPYIVVCTCPTCIMYEMFRVTSPYRSELLNACVRE